MSLHIKTLELKSLIQKIEENNIRIQSHNRNANYGNIGAVLAYTLTSGSNSRTTRTLGQIGALGGLVYSGSERNKGNNLGLENLLSLKQNADSIFNNSVLTLFKNEYSSTSKSEYLSLCLTYASYYDQYLLKYISKLEVKSFLGEKNRSLLFNLEKIDLFTYKEKMLKFFSGIDRSVNTRAFSDYKTDISLVDISKLKNECMVLTVSLFSLGALGGLFFYFQNQFLGVLSLVLLILIFLSMIYLPFLPETKKAQNLKFKFLNAIKKNCNLKELKFY